MSNINPKMNNNSDWFVSKPVDEICEKIENSESNKIIVTGNRYSGKTTVLKRLEERGLNTDNQTICTDFLYPVLPAKEPDACYDKEFFNSFYEALFTKKILKYILHNNRAEFYNYFGYDSIINSYCLKDTEHFINANVLFKNMIRNDSSYFPKKKEYSKDLLEKMKNLLEVEKINLAIINFDQTNNSSKYAQNLLSDYFDMFDKVILEVHDQKINRKKLIEKGYDFQRVNYGYRKDVIKDILLKRIKRYNDGDIEYRIPKHLYRDENLIKVFKKANGNISLMIDSLFAADELRRFQGIITPDTINNVIEAEKSKTLKYSNNPNYNDKLYL